ncbi:uncharacterized protein BYT42DRAFT_571375 [Radiomyces spectabilis]|uniref:uncharacterized protein n=1 Tax=Radiomyces spectabilis TaxID=64574 RepID=UPI00221FFB4D|nr:uncharacterized protein BYT42DRAFT_571375 [Radiomyces spectabilis]KAI8377726.1 hypothetical protein BYT42DRAFT_571375 [Radiomyces spectabilis]
MSFCRASLPLSPPLTTDRELCDSLYNNKEEEVPASAPVFEGHLYLCTNKSGKKKWQWRLFRFDGTSLSCLSSRKVKLPPDTFIDMPVDPTLRLTQLDQDPCSATLNLSLTSPLLATPKTNHRLSLLKRRHSDRTHGPKLASYYQYPKWTVDITNISSISILKPDTPSSKQINTLPLLNLTQSRCFCVRTFDGQCHVMKAPKDKDLERWLFVLTKMWKYANAVRDQLLAQSQPMARPMNSNDLVGYPPLATDPNVPTTAMHSATPPLRDYGIPSPAQEKSFFEPSDAPKHLSLEKAQWIDEWSRSIAELVAQDPHVEFVPPPIESIPDDDQMSLGSGMTSISARGKAKPVLPAYDHPQGETQWRTLEKDKNNSDHPTPYPQESPVEGRPHPVLRKKRSDDVKNWITRQSPTDQAPGEHHHRSLSPSHRRQSLNILSSMRHDDQPSSPHVSQLQSSKITRRASAGLISHSFTNYRSQSQPLRDDIDDNLGNDGISVHPTPPLHHQDGYNDIHRIHPSLLSRTPSMQTLQQQHQQQRGTAVHQPGVDDDDISLADLQRSLRRLSMNTPRQPPRHKLSRSSMDLQRPYSVSYDSLSPYCHPTQGATGLMTSHSTRNRMSPLVAPALPPIPRASSTPLTTHHLLSYPAMVDTLKETHRVRYSLDDPRLPHAKHAQQAYPFHPLSRSTWDMAPCQKLAPLKVKSQSIDKDRSHGLGTHYQRHSVDLLPDQTRYYRP